MRAERDTLKRAVKWGCNAGAFKFSSHRSIIHEIEQGVRPHRKQSRSLLAIGSIVGTSAPCHSKCDCDPEGRAAKHAAAQQQLRDNIDERTRISTYNGLINF